MGGARASERTGNCNDANPLFAFGQFPLIHMSVPGGPPTGLWVNVNVAAEATDGDRPTNNEVADTNMRMRRGGRMIASV